MISFDGVADEYDSTRGLPDEEMRPLLAEMSAKLSTCRSLLDIAVGTGRFAVPLQSSGFEVCGVDVSRRMMAKARVKGMRDLVGSDVRSLPFRDKVFDAAVITHLLHLIQEPGEVVREASRVVRKMILSPIEVESGPKARELYAKMLGEEGMPSKLFTGGEAGLAALVPPSEVIRIRRAREVTTVDEWLTRLEKRQSSITWGVPEEIHNRILSKMRSSVGGERVDVTISLEVAVWEPEQLATFSLRGGSEGPTG